MHNEYYTLFSKYILKTVANNACASITVNKFITMNVLQMIIHLQPILHSTKDRQAHKEKKTKDPALILFTAACPHEHP
jgi:hypothetical protein